LQIKKSAVFVNALVDATAQARQADGVVRFSNDLVDYLREMLLAARGLNL
jgi:hypothetical protein